MINIQPVSNVLGVMLIAIGALMWTAIPFSLYYQSGDAVPLFSSGIITIGIGLLSWLFKFRSSAKVNKREAYVIVAFGWLAFTCFSTIPYLLSETCTNFADAFFEAASGLSTTGATILTDIESVPEGILFWRSLTHWIGGMGIIVLTVAIFPLLGIGGNDLFVAEAPGIKSDKIHPRISQAAKRLWLIYVSLTAILTGLLWAFEMNFFDAINHAFSCMATGGFSTRNSSIAEYSAVIQYTLILFMFLGGTNLGLIYFGLKGKFKKLFRDDEFKLYLMVFAFCAILFSVVLFSNNIYGLEESFRKGAFQVISLITTTGFVTGDYTSWGPFLLFTSFLLIFVGASSQSTAGGIKMGRHFIFLSNIRIEFKKLLHPRAIIPLYMNDRIVPESIITRVQVFLILYLGIFFLGSLILTSMGIDFETSLGAAAASISNVGPGIGKVGPSYDYAWMPASAKYLLGLIMIIGRLEIFSVLILFVPYFWRNT